MRVGVVTFPGSLDDVDAQRAVRIGGNEAVSLWHGDADLKGVDAVILPGGFSYGDYLRCGAISRFAPVMDTVVEAANSGVPVLGICNGFQILCESHLLPGALIRNDHRKFVCRDQLLRIENNATPWTSAYEVGQEIRIDGLVCLFDAEGPCANAVKDSQRTKTSDATTRTLSAVTPCTGSAASCRSPTRSLLNKAVGLGLKRRDDRGRAGHFPP